MEGTIHFTYKNKDHSANYLICQRQEPHYIFIFFKNEELMKEFGAEICIHSAGNAMLEDNIFSENRRNLFASVFPAVMQHSYKHHNINTIQQTNNHE